MIKEGNSYKEQIMENQHKEDFVKTLVKELQDKVFYDLTEKAIENYLPNQIKAFVSGNSSSMLELYSLSNKENLFQTTVKINNIMEESERIDKDNWVRKEVPQIKLKYLDQSQLIQSCILNSQTLTINLILL